MNPSKKILLLGAAILVAFQAQAKDVERVVAVVNGEKITLSTIEKIKKQIKFIRIHLSDIA